MEDLIKNKIEVLEQTIDVIIHNIGIAKKLEFEFQAKVLEIEKNVYVDYKYFLIELLDYKEDDKTPNKER